MESIKTTLRRGRFEWDKINMPAAEFQSRVARAREVMKREKIDVLVVYGNTWIDPGDPCYISNLYMNMESLAALIPLQGEVALAFWGSGRGIQHIERNTWVKVLRPNQDVVGACTKYIGELGLIPSTIGLVGVRKLMRNVELQRFLKSLGSSMVVDADHIIRDMRMVKSTREIDQIHRASRILTNAFESILLTQNDLNEIALDTFLDREIRLAGAEDVRQLYAIPGKEEWHFRPVEDRKLSFDDSIIIYLAVAFERYWAETIRTFVVKQEGLAEANNKDLDELYTKVLRKMEPGKKITQFHREVVEEVKNSGAAFIPEYGLGQGIGMSLEEAPEINNKNSGVLLPGNCLTLRLGMKDSRGVVMVGNTIHLADDGPELLTN